METEEKLTPAEIKMGFVINQLGYKVNPEWMRLCQVHEEMDRIKSRW